MPLVQAAISSSGEDPRPTVANCLVLTKVDADLAPSADSQRPRGRPALPIFIRQGRPQAMNHLPLTSQPLEPHRVPMRHLLSPLLSGWTASRRHSATWGIAWRGCWRIAGRSGAPHTCRGGDCRGCGVMSGVRAMGFPRLGGCCPIRRGACGARSVQQAVKLVPWRLPATQLRMC